MTQSEPPCAWSLHPSAPTSFAPVKMKVEEEKKTEPPKGVPLQFDINSVGKPTAMTLNERFRILKDERGPAKAANSSLWVKTMTQRRRGIPKTFVSQTDTHTDTDPHLSDDIEAF